jgi:hypothetical protein
LSHQLLCERTDWGKHVMIEDLLEVNSLCLFHLQAWER